MTATPEPPLPPYTGRASASEPEPQPQPQPQAALPPTIVWHSQAALIATGGVALLAGILTIVGGLNFPSGAPVEQLYCFGLIIDLAAVVIVTAALTAVEFSRRREWGHAGLPVDTRRSVFAIVAIALSAVAAIAWAGGGGIEQLGYLLSGIRARYMLSTGGLFLAGIPWALGAIFGVLGYRPGGHRVTNGLALGALGIWFVLVLVTTTAALVYGAKLSD